MSYKRVVIKIGTSTLTYQNSKINLKIMDRLARVLTDLRNQGLEVVLVSSGAIAVGANKLSLATRPRDVKGKQATSAVGQGVLMQMYEKFFSEYNQIIAQILLTKDVLTEEERKQNAKNTFDTLLEMEVIPIVNENDTVSTEELDFSDNDTLSAYVASLIESDLLVILSDIDGLYSSDPNVNEDATIIPVVEKIDDYIHSIAGGSQSSVGTGGMSTKISAATLATSNHIDTVIAKGEDPAILYDIINNLSIGTKFLKN